MTASSRLRAFPRWPAVAGWIAPVALVSGLVAVVAGRWLATRSGVDALLVGAGFGLALAGLASVSVRLAAAPGGHRSIRPNAGGASGSPSFILAGGVGVAFGLVLVGLALLGPALAGIGTVPGLGRPAAPFVSWAAITILVAAAEEVLLRGVLFDRIRRVGGVPLAILLTSAVFALMHVPLYGWHVVPLDFAVGLGLAGLRLTTRTVLAPVAAHVVADLATWWL